MTLLKSKWTVQVIILLILAVGVLLRLKTYGDPHLSIASDDTPGYVSSSEAPLLSWEIFTGRRLFTTNILYKFFEPEEGYKILANGSSDTTRRVIQPGFDSITVLQFIVSIICWSFLIVTISKYINFPPLKILSAIILLLFAFTPQIAEWDSVLMSESLTFSLFALQFALVIRIIFMSQDGKENPTPFLVFWIVVVFAWTFLRDTNVYAIPANLALMMILWFSPKFKKSRLVAILMVTLLGFFLLGFYTSRSSPRDTIEIGHVYKNDLLPHPARVEALQKMGMPSPDSEEFEQWFEAEATSAFMKFMITHPGYTFSKLGNDILYAFGESMQPYFKIPELGYKRYQLIQIGYVLHPDTATPLLISLLILPILLYFSWRNIGNSRPWAWVASWAFVAASITIAISILAGVGGLTRHTLFSTMLYRLLMWILIFIVLDTVIENTQNQETRTENHL